MICILSKTRLYRCFFKKQKALKKSVCFLPGACQTLLSAIWRTTQTCANSLSARISKFLIRFFQSKKSFKFEIIIFRCFRFCSKLSTISIRNCPQVGDDLLRTFGSLRSLRNVDLSSCPCITDAGVRHLVDGPSGPQLTQLNLSSINGLTDVAMYRITSKCQKLIFLDMSYNERITDSGFELLSSTKIECKYF